MLPKSFTFSAPVTFICLALAGVMLWASSWQWERYKYKTALLARYQTNATSPAMTFPVSPESPESYTALLHHKVHISGTYDFSHQIILLNQRHASGPGYLLMTPLKLTDSNLTVMVSRGFIPFESRDPATWSQYSFSEADAFDAVVQSTVPHGSLFSPENPNPSSPKDFRTQWLYPELDKMAVQFPYPILTTIYLQRLGAPPTGQFPAEAISIQVPPSTHFGYTFEWILLAIVTLVLGFFIQAYPGFWKRRKVGPKLKQR